MTDVFSRKKRSEVMASIKASGNATTELRLIALFRLHGICGWRRNQKLPGRPDFTFRRIKTTVFVDGCYWHGCPRHGRIAGSNSTFWKAKILRNKARDRSVSSQLRRRGWRVLRIWEHDTKRGILPRRILKALKAA